MAFTNSFPHLVRVSYCQIFVLILCVQVGFCQQESLRMVYPFIPLSINPAKAGSQGVATITGLYRKKPLFQAALGGPSSSQQYFSFDMPFARETWGIGFLGYNTDQSYATNTGGISANLGVAGLVSKTISWKRGKTFRIGGQVGVNQYPILGQRGTSTLSSHIGGGVEYQDGDLVLGLAKPVGFANAAPLYATGQYLIALPANQLVKVGALVRLANAQTKLDLNAIYWWNEKVGLGLWWQNTGSEFGNTALLGSVEVALGRNFRFGYAYDFLGQQTNALPAGFGTSSSTLASGFHQLFLRYEVDLGNGKIAAFRP